MGKFTEYNVPLKSLTAGKHEFEYHLGQEFFNNMENQDVRGADLNVKLTVNNAHDRYSLHFAITGEVILLCDRCLDDLHFPIDATYDIVVEYGADYDDASDDLLIIPESDNNLNVAYMIHDTVALAIPIKHVHPMGKCNRQMSALLRKHRGHNGGEDSELEEQLIDEIDTIDSDEGTTDSRWDALKNLNTSGDED